jgi:hypothetical protein
MIVNWKGFVILTNEVIDDEDFYPQEHNPFIN